MNISGDFNSTQRELGIVKKIFDAESIEYESIEKNADADAGDVLVKLKNGRQILIEVKEEKYDRFIKYGDLGIDFISVFYFKNGHANWKGSPKSPRLLENFIADIDRRKYYKDGKVVYSKSDLWLFFVSKDGEIYYYCFLDGKKVVKEEFISHLKKNCLFAINNKPFWQNSNKDDFNSAVFYINHHDPFLNNYKVTLRGFLNLN